MGAAEIQTVIRNLQINKKKAMERTLPDELSPEEKEMFQKCLELSVLFSQDHTSSVALQYMNIREKITSSGLDEKYKKWFFNEK